MNQWTTTKLNIFTDVASSTSKHKVRVVSQALVIYNETSETVDFCRNAYTQIKQHTQWLFTVETVDFCKKTLYTDQTPNTNFIFSLTE